MKSLLYPLFTSLFAVVSLASGATNVSYTATADPNANPDSTTGTGATANAWTLTHGGDTAGASTSYTGSYYSQGGMLGTAWAIYSNHDYTTTATSTATAATSEADQTSTFVGGALTIGQTVSINFLANSVDTYQQYGIRLSTGTAFVLSLSFIGGDGGYRYYDATTGGNIPFGYQQNGFNFAYTQMTATTYKVVATPIGGGTAIGTFTGTVSGAPNTIQIYNESAGDNNNVLTNSLVIVPEPAGTVWVDAGGLAIVLVGLYKRRGSLGPVA